MLANYLFAVLMPVCVCVSAVVTCECVDLDSSACAAGLLALQAPLSFVRVFWINDRLSIARYIRSHIHFLWQIYLHLISFFLKKKRKNFTHRIKAFCERFYFKY